MNTSWKSGFGNFEQVFAQDRLVRKSRLLGYSGKGVARGFRGKGKRRPPTLTHGCGSYHFGVGAPPILVYFSGDWDVRWGYGTCFLSGFRSEWLEHKLDWGQ